MNGSIMLLAVCLAVLISSSTTLRAFAADGPKTPEALASLYMSSFNKKDKATIKKLRFPSSVKSDMQSMMDEISDAEMSSGTQYNKFEVTPIKADMAEAKMGPDGLFYKPVIKPTHIVKFIAKTANGSSSTSMPVGPDKGIFYIATIVPAKGAQPAYKFGWERYTMPGTTWSVMLPNEPEPGRAALESESGPDALKNPDAYGVVKNTASIKTAQHWFWCGEEGKRVNAPDNQEHYRAACTTYEPATLNEWFSDSKKTLDEAVQMRVRENEGKLVSVKEIDMSGAPGREFEIREKDGKLILGRAYWIKDALYELTFDSKKEKPNTEAAQKLLGSLQVQ
jgi:hypothetical protein